MLKSLECNCQLEPLLWFCNIYFFVFSGVVNCSAVSLKVPDGGLYPHSHECSVCPHRHRGTLLQRKTILERTTDSETCREGRTIWGLSVCMCVCLCVSLSILVLLCVKARMNVKGSVCLWLSLPCWAFAQRHNVYLCCLSPACSLWHNRSACSCGYETTCCACAEVYVNEDVQQTLLLLDLI